MGRPVIENLDPCRDTETAKARGKQGGIKSGQAKREKKRMSQILADYLQKEHEVVLRDDDGRVIDRETLPADELIARTITAIIARDDSASVSMLKELREATEGNKLAIAGENGAPVKFQFVEPKNASTEKV